jgi:hypothetical protein
MNASMPIAKALNALWSKITGPTRSETLLVWFVEEVESETPKGLEDPDARRLLCYLRITGPISQASLALYLRREIPEGLTEPAFIEAWREVGENVRSTLKKLIADGFARERDGFYEAV